jgi:uncharacterized protein (DUF2236 family)
VTATSNRPRVADTEGKVTQGKVTKADILGTERRWRRGREPIPAGVLLNEDGTPDYGVFGPGSVVWDVLLHPSIAVFHHIGQVLAQDTYKPIVAGIRDHEPVVRKAREGALTVFDGFERASRGAGIHGIMWLSDTTTAQSMADFLHKVHTKVAGPIIDQGEPELGGYAASEPRESMWAALTEMHPMLRMYEAFAFRDGKRPHRLSPEQRDQFIKEAGAYLRIHHAPEDEIPTNMAELRALYAKYDRFFGHSDTIQISPDYGDNYMTLMTDSVKKNFKLSQLRAAIPMLVLYQLVRTPAIGALPPKARQALGLTPEEDARAVKAAKRALPLMWLLQRRPIERHYLRLMWGPDGVKLFDAARKLHKQARR